MKNRVLEGIQPERVFYYFEELCKIPHGSGNTKLISDYCVLFAKQHGLRCIQDDVNNIVIFKNGTAGYEAHPAVILQGHLDMVAEKEPGCGIDFANDGLQIQTDGEFVFAKGTTLGGDDGIAVAYALAILEADSIQHPPLECVFTVDEEVGMDGAAALDTSVLNGRIMINADSEDEGIFTVSCAGGATSRITLPVEYVPFSGDCIHIEINGLIGGHSGQEINKGRANANILMGALLRSVYNDIPFLLVSVCGGQKDNAIPRYCDACIAVESERINETITAIRFAVSEISKTLPAEETSFLVNTDVSSGMKQAMSEETTRKLIGLLCALPNGVQKMSSQIPGLVQTSLNLGILTTQTDETRLTFSVRSSVNSEKQDLLHRMSEIAGLYGASFELSGEYPAWEYKEKSRLRDVMTGVFKEQYGRLPVIEAIHAGLECGLFSDKIPGLDCVSIGPDMQDIHTTREKLNIASVARTWEFLTAVLAVL